MARFGNNFEGGTNGLTITSGNSSAGGNDSYGTSIGASSTITYASTAASHGSLGARIETTAAGVASFLQQDITPADRNVLRFYFKAESIPDIYTNIAQLRGTAGAAVQVAITSSGTFCLTDINAVEIANTRMSTPLTASTWYRIEVACTPGTSATSGVVEFAYYLNDSASPITSGTISGVNAGSVQIFRYRLGRPSSSNFIGVFDFDDAAAEDLDSGFIGPYVASIVITPTPYQMVWSGTAWLYSPQDELVWNGTTWA